MNRASDRRARGPSLKATLTIAFFLVGAIALLASGSLQMVSVIQAQKRAVANEQRVIAQDAARNVSVFVQDKLDTISRAAWVTSLYAASPERLNLELAGLLGIQPSFRELLLLDAEGGLKYRIARLPGRSDLMGRLNAEAIAEARKAGGYVSPVYIDSVSSVPLIAIAAPMTDAFKDYRGVIAAEVDLSFMWDLVSSLRVGKSGYAYVVDGEGILIAFSDIARVLKGENVGRLRPVEEFKDGRPGTAESTARPYRGILGSAVAGAFVPLGTPDWAVVTELPWAEAYREVIRQFTIMAIITLVVATLASLSGALIARRLTVPLSELMGIATRIAGGDRDLQAEVRGPSEVAGLASAFNSMTSQLRMSLESLERRYDELKRAEQSLRESEERFRSLVETTSDWVWETDLDGVYVYASPRVADVLGYAPEEIVGRTLFDLMPSGTAEAVAAEFRACAEAGKPFLRKEYEKVRKDGRNIVAESSGAPAFGENGGLRGYRGVDRDITEIKRAQAEQAILEEQLQQAMKMEAIGQLAGGVAHDFNNLLTVIIGNVDLARLEFKATDPAMAFFEPIFSAAESAAGLTRQLLAFARRQLIQPKVVSLNELVGKFMKSFVTLLGEDVALRTALDPGLVLVRVDPGQIEQILVNLATNARAAMPTGGEIFIETSNAYLDEEYCSSHAETRPGEYALLAVTDTGTGMDEETKSHIFEPFFTTKPSGRGTGLGLATVFGIVKQSRGFIEVYSEPGQGTQFKIYLPRAVKGREEIVQDAPFVDLPTGNQTIFIAEDNEEVRRSTLRTLQVLRYKVTAPSTGEELLEIAAEHQGRIDLLITDVVMPRMNGPELAERLKALHPEARVLFTSGYTYNVIAHHGIVNDGVNFLSKPFTIRALAEKVKQILSS